MITEKVYSSIYDKNIKNNIIDSSIWKNCHKEEEISDELKKEMNCYTIKFDGLKPIQVTNIKKAKI